MQPNPPGMVHIYLKTEEQNFKGKPSNMTQKVSKYKKHTDNSFIFKNGVYFFTVTNALGKMRI